MRCLYSGFNLNIGALRMFTIGSQIYRRLFHGCCVTLFLLVFLTGSSTAADSTPGYDVPAEGTSLRDFSVRYITDTTRSLTVDEIASGRISGKFISSRFYIPVLDADHWFVFTLNNPSAGSTDLIVRFDEPYMANADLYYRVGNGWHVERNGLVLPINKRSLKTRSPGFPVTLSAGESKTFYLKLHSKYYLLTLGLRVESSKVFHESEQFQTGYYGLYVGAVLAMIFYNLFLFVSLRERLYCYYVLHGFCYLVFVVIYSGFDLYVHSSESFHYMLNTATAMAVGFFTLFTRNLLRTRHYMPRMDKIVVALAFSCFVSALLILIDIRNYHLLVMLGMPGMLFLFLIGIYACFKRIELARLYVFGLGWYIIGVFLIASVNAGLVPYNLITRYGYLAGSLIELMIFSLALAYRVKLLQEEKLKIQQRLVTTEQQDKQRMELLVQERTAKLEKANQQLERLSQVDGLSGLFNRGFFDKTLQNEWLRLLRSGQSLCLIMCDIDFFKQYNDTFGHQDGDNCIREAADTIRKVASRSSDICARYGGDEFVILLPETDLSGGECVAQEIWQLIRDKNLPHKTAPGRVTMSFGVTAVIPRADLQPEDLISFADKALYQSKNNGRDMVSVFQGQNIC
jgi:diguanylate cyclase (GGDEF)-like protein